MKDAVDHKVTRLLASADRALKDAEKLLEVAVVAKRLRKCPETVRRYIRSGRLRAARAPGETRGGNYLVPESAVSEFLATSRNISLHAGR